MAYELSMSVSPDQPNLVILDVEQLDATLSVPLLNKIRQHRWIEQASERHLHTAITKSRRLFLIFCMSAIVSDNAHVNPESRSRDAPIQSEIGCLPSPNDTPILTKLHVSQVLSECLLAMYEETLETKKQMLRAFETFKRNKC
jgi:hypothetical protein